MRKERASNARPDASVSPVHITRARTTSGHRTPFARVSLGRVSRGSTHETVPGMQARRGLLENSDSIAPIVAEQEESLASAPSRTPEVLSHEHLTCARHAVLNASECMIMCLAEAFVGARRAEFEAKNMLCRRRAPRGRWSTSSAHQAVNVSPRRHSRTSCESASRA